MVVVAVVLRGNGIAFGYSSESGGDNYRLW